MLSILPSFLETIFEFTERGRVSVDAFAPIF